MCFLYIARQSGISASRLSATDRSFSCGMAETVDDLMMWLRIERGPGEQSSHIWAKVLPDTSPSITSHSHLQPRDEAYPRLLLLSGLPSRSARVTPQHPRPFQSPAPRYTAICHKLVTSTHRLSYQTQILRRKPSLNQLSSHRLLPSHPLRPSSTPVLKPPTPEPEPPNRSAAIVSFVGRGILSTKRD